MAGFNHKASSSGNVTRMRKLALYKFFRRISLPLYQTDIYKEDYRPHAIYRLGLNLQLRIKGICIKL